MYSAIFLYYKDGVDHINCRGLNLQCYAHFISLSSLNFLSVKVVFQALIDSNAQFSTIFSLRFCLQSFFTQKLEIIHIDLDFGASLVARLAYFDLYQTFVTFYLLDY